MRNRVSSQRQMEMVERIRRATLTVEGEKILVYNWQGECTSFDLEPWKDGQGLLLMARIHVLEGRTCAELAKEYWVSSLPSTPYFPEESQECSCSDFSVQRQTKRDCMWVLWHPWLLPVGLYSHQVQSDQAQTNT